LTDKENVSLNLLVAYDLKYSDTKSTDYTNVNTKILDLVDDTYFIGNTSIQKEIDYLNDNNVINQEEAQLFFKGGYAAKRNAVLYTAMKNKIDYLIFLDDDEYPIAVTNTRSSAIWGGQQVLSTHLKNIASADITNGHHCGYISPIPYIKFNNKMTEDDFRLFIEAISNDIINWDTLKGYGYGLGVRCLLDPIPAGTMVKPGEFGWDGAAGTWFSVDPHEDMTIVYMVQRFPANHIRFIPRLQATIYAAL